MKEDVNYKSPLYVFHKGCFLYTLNNELELVALQAKIAITRSPDYTISCPYKTYRIPENGRIDEGHVGSDFKEEYLNSFEKYCIAIISAGRRNQRK